VPFAYCQTPAEEQQAFFSSLNLLVGIVGFFSRCL
jgi:hypothetical protein